MKKFKNIYIEITKACNLKCPFCPSKDVSEKDYLSFDNFKYIIDQIKDYTDGIYLHILGEPLLHKDVFKFIDYASKYVKVSLTTNGRLINKWTNELINSNLYVINISLQSLITENIIYIDEYLDNVEDLIKNKPDSLAIHLRIWNNKEKNGLLNNYLNNYLFDRKLDSYKNVNISVQDEFKWPSLDDKINEIKSSCLGGKSQIGILLNGDVCICCLDYLGHTSIGNIYQSTFDNMIKNELYQNVLKGWINKEPYFELCKKCTFRNRFRKLTI